MPLTEDEVREIFKDEHENYADREYLKFDKVENKLNYDSYIHALILLSQILPEGHRAFAGADHDVIYLEGTLEKLAQYATRDQLVELVRCGVTWDSNVDCLVIDI